MTDNQPDYAKVINRNFTYHAPNDTQIQRMQSIREVAKNLAHLINSNCKFSRETALALTKLEESVMWANASIVRNERPTQESNDAERSS